MKHDNTEIGYTTETYSIFIDGIRCDGNGYSSLEDAEQHLPKTSKGKKYQILLQKSENLIFNYRDNGSKK